MANPHSKNEHSFPLETAVRPSRCGLGQLITIGAVPDHEDNEAVEAERLSLDTESLRPQFS